jgi:hypothetical protein
MGLASLQDELLFNDCDMPTINTDHLMLPPKAMLRSSFCSFCFMKKLQLF